MRRYGIMMKTDAEGAEFMHSIYEMKFRRRFSVNPYKTLRMKLGEMSLFKNWIDDTRGDPYPVVSSNEQEGAALTEKVRGGRYCVQNNTERQLYKARLLGQHFPYATYEIALDELEACAPGGIGVQVFAHGEEGSDYSVENEPCARILAGVQDGQIVITRHLSMGGCEGGTETVESGMLFAPGMSLIVTARGMFFDVYLKSGDVPAFVRTFELREFRHILKYDTFMRSTASVCMLLSPGERAQLRAEFYLEGGISHADMKCMRYENGMPIMKDGRLYMTMSSRLEAGGFQSVISWNPSTADLRMEGALFFDLGDGAWCSDVASSVVYNRKTDEWYVWSCAFSHGHILCHAVSYADLRCGIHVLDAEIMPVEQAEAAEGGDSLSMTSGGSGSDARATLSDDRLFFGKYGDEDPDLVYDEQRGKWLLAVCRPVSVGKGSAYRYFLFESDDPFTGYTFVDCSTAGANTGGSIIRVGGELYLLCGSDFDKRAQYQLRRLDDLSEYTLLSFDFDDGGFRGWGTLIPVPCGRRTRYVLMTFDRHNGSSYNWSYGNIYVFEADKMKPGCEWPG